MKYKLAILFTQPPFGSSASREGLDALLAASAFCEEDQIAICFWGDGVFNLLAGQKPEQILQKDHISTFKLIELYDLTQCFACEEDLASRHLIQADWIIDFQTQSQADIMAILNQSEKVLTF
ncbi:tRNA 2-thiouridine(34) synthase TusC [Pasteurellaceae bacterium RH1A]|nr:tRNA 2-thiouridine(34) synthase TusC [Pasteurellaceae bacterium RH1A]